MPKLLTDDEVLGASAAPGLLTDDQVLGTGSSSTGKASGSIAGELLPVILGGINRGGRGLARMVTDAAQAPIDTINAGLANVPAAADRLLTKGLSEFLPLPSGKPWQENETLQQVGRTMSAVAADTRERNRNDDDQSLASWLNPRTAIARVGLGLERRMASDQAEESAMLASAAPNITAQAKAVPVGCTSSPAGLSRTTSRSSSWSTAGSGGGGLSGAIPGMLTCRISSPLSEDEARSTRPAPSRTMPWRIQLLSSLRLKSENRLARNRSSRMPRASAGVTKVRTVNGDGVESDMSRDLIRYEVLHGEMLTVPARRP